MAIKHAVVKAPGQKLFAVADWNADHTFLQTDIDHNQITNTHNLTVDIDHNTITNTHNLTIDIDHNLLTNYAANRHFLESEISHLNILNIGTNTHAQIDTHIADTTNPHSVSYTQTGGQEILPIGTVLMYNGTGIANVSARTTQLGDEIGDTITLTGWYVCNGNASTPNLFNKFIRAETASGNTGGSDDAIVVSHTHTNSVGNQSASHNHIFTGNLMANHGHADTFAFSGNLMATHNHTFTGSLTTTGNQSASHYHTHNHPARASGNQSASHIHTFSGNALGTHDHLVGNFEITDSLNRYGHTYIGTTSGYKIASAYPNQTVYVANTSDRSAGTPSGTIGNQSASHTHTTDLPSINSGNQSASHNHTLTPLGSNTAASAGTPAGSITGAVTAASAGTPAGTLGNQSASHNHTVTINSTGSSGTGANIPAYYSLIFIIRMS